ncbi:hypothetical protein HZA86_05640 [Candidatus Uhrbacteria bacterium]|nr:hypothetical protein [Candidatus Uhrbacteria bacterium]
MLDSNDLKLIGQEVAKVIEDNVNPQFESANQQFKKIDGQFREVHQRLNKIEATMVTKDYLDEKLGDLRGDLVVLMRKEDTKLRSLVNILRSKNMLNDDDVKRLFTMEPFAQLM